MARLEVLGQSERLSVGAVVLARLDTGEFGYLQYVRPGWFAPVVRVLPGTFERPVEGRALRRLVEGPTLFVTEFDVDGLIATRRGKVVGQLAVPERDQEMPFFRGAVPRSEECPNGWRVKDRSGESLTERQFAERHPGVELDSLPLELMPLQPTLIWMMEVQWTPRLARGNDLRLPPRPAGSEEASTAVATSPRRSLSIAHVLVFPSEQSAERAAAELVGERGFADADVEESSSPGEWLVWAHRRGRATEADRDLAAAVARTHGGYYDGNLVGPLN